ncbi:MAG: hypothetical protein O7D91_17670 [Planctomycetota bacterium]|nr:hypothetical protein [Planctomycetota bacterium]
MQKVTVRKSELLEALKENRAQHRKIFEEACEGFRVEACRLLKQKLDDAKEGRRINLSFSLTQPVDQTREYDQVIRMCEMSLDDQIELENHEFQQFVMDRWDWRDQFLMSNSRYSATASAMVS